MREYMMLYFYNFVIFYKNKENAMSRPRAVLRAAIQSLTLEIYAGRKKYECTADMETYSVSLHGSFFNLHRLTFGGFNLWCPGDTHVTTIGMSDDLYQPLRELWQLMKRGGANPNDPLLKFLEM